MNVCTMAMIVGFLCMYKVKKNIFLSFSLCLSSVLLKRVIISSLETRSPDHPRNVLLIPMIYDMNNINYMEENMREGRQS